MKHGYSYRKVDYEESVVSPPFEIRECVGQSVVVECVTVETVWDQWQSTSVVMATNYIEGDSTDLSPSLVEVNRVCGSVSGGGVCYSGDSVGSVAV